MLDTASCCGIAEFKRDIEYSCRHHTDRLLAVDLHGKMAFVNVPEAPYVSSLPVWSMLTKFKALRNWKKLLEKLLELTSQISMSLA